MSVQNISSNDAFDYLSNQNNTILVDVRTQEEFDSIGVVDLSSLNKEAIFIPWRLLPDMSINADFEFELIDKIKKHINANENEINLLFLCRSGARSMEAALFMSDIGYNCFNIEKGFEGDPDDKGVRANINGWKFNNKPWKKNN
ncbi:rhodanese-like domain-containing protein [Rickettsiales bacterium]|nr:rhodanese-like domain-containing protein [Rickettsiales bacterium]MDB2550874.1 rhodanese-like domain-containing protein [Rickettsiales bacterium]